MANKKFGETLRNLRNKKGYTQQQVADILGLKNKSTLGSWEVGKSEPDGYTLLKLCKIYEVEDIYSAFDEISPSSTNVDAVIKKVDENNMSKYSPYEKELISVFETLSPITQKYLINIARELLENQKELLNQNKNT